MLCGPALLTLGCVSWAMRLSEGSGWKIGSGWAAVGAATREAEARMQAK